METSVITFTIATTFDEWAKAYDGSLDLQRQAGITSLFRGAHKDDPTTCVAILQAAPGKLNEFMAANAEMVAKSGHVLESTVITTYLG
jgi:hypothetical protein